MRAFIFCFLLTLSCFINSISAQSDSLVTALEKTLQAQIDALGEEHLDVAMFCDSLGVIYKDAANYAKADSLFTKALEIKVQKLEKNHPDIANSYYNIGNISKYTGDYAKADSLFTKALNIRLDIFGEKHIDVATSYNGLGIIYDLTGDYENAISFYNKALNIRIDVLGEKHQKVAGSYHNLGTVHCSIGNYEKAINFYNKALDLGIEILGEKHPQIAGSYHNLGLVYWQMGNYEKAISFYNKALDLGIEILGEKHPQIAQSYNSLGATYHITGDHEKAISFYRKALIIRIDVFGEKHPDIASSYNNLGVVYRQIGDYEKAISFYNKALDLGVEILGEKHPDVASFYNNLGLLYRQTGDYEKAISFYNKALNVWFETFGEKHTNIAISYNDLGNVNSEMGDYEKAISFHNKALNINLELFGEKHHNVGISYNDLGTIYSKIDDYTQADSLFTKALNILSKLFDENHPDVASSYNGLGLVYHRKGDYEKAISFYNKALYIRSNVFGEKHPDVASSYLNLALVNEATGNYQIADSLWHILIPRSIKDLKSTYLFLPTDQRVKYSGTFSWINNDFYSFAVNNGVESTRQLATNCLLNIKSLTLDYGISTNQLIQEINDTTLSYQHQQLNKLNKQLADAETLTTEEREEKGWDLSKIQNEQDNLAFQMLQHPQLKSRLNTEILEWQDIQNHLTPDAAAIDFIETYDMQDDTSLVYYAIVVHKDLSSPQFVRIANEKTLAKLLQTDKNKRPGYLSGRSSRKALQKVLWQPLKSYLEGIKTVHISPSGILHRVPFESLQDAENEYLATQYDFHYYSATRDMLKQKPQKTTYKDMVLMGHILYDLDNKEQYEEEEKAFVFEGTRNTRDSIRPLPGTLREVIEIKKVGKKARLKTTMLSIDAASEDTVQYFVGEREPSIMHFATHGVFLPPLEKRDEGHDLIGTQDRLRAADNPLQRSALMLYGANETWTKGRPILGSGEDGILTALEVTTLDLQNTDLVVLSACSTGLGNVHNTEGVFGLQRAFKLAGVNYVLASLWDVDDVATKDLMVKFYKNLLKEKQDPATALRNAKNYFHDKGYEPVDWAGFILIE